MSHPWYSARVGDIVRVIDGAYPFGGRTGEVTAIDHANGSLRVQLDGHSTSLFFLGGELIRIERQAEENDPSMKPTNPKDAIGSDKLPVHLWPETATLMGCLGMLDGALKYGRNNWRETGVRVSIYVDALRRHINAYFEGEDLDPDSGVPHLSHALACLAILVDAQAAGMLNDDRNYPGGYRQLVDDLTPHVKRLKDKHADKDPKHWTVGDA